MAEAMADRAIRKLRRRIWLVRALDRLSLTLLVSFLALFLLAAARHLLIILHPEEKAGWLLAALWLAGGALSLAGRPEIREAALAGDRLGLQDRLCTHLEYRDRGGPVLEAFKEELEDTLGKISPARLYPLSFPGKRIMAAVMAVAAAGVVFWLPSPVVREAALRESVNSELRQEAEKVALMKKALGEESGDREAGPLKNSAAPLLEELEKKLQRGTDYREASLQVGDVLREIQTRGISSGDLNGLAGVFQGAGEEAAAAGRLLRSGDVQGAVNTMEKINFNREERKVMLENVKRLLREGEATEAAGKALQEFKKALEKENFSSGELAGVLNSLAGTATEGGKLEETEKKLAGMKERLMARGGGFENPGGDGGRQLARQGEAVATPGEAAGESLTGQSGWEGMSRREPGALGGGLPGSGAEGGPGREGPVKKGGEPLPASAGNPRALEVRGEWQEKGGISETPSDRVLGLAGNGGDYAALYREFRKEGAAYADRFEIPPDQRQLVLGYFDKLRGDSRYAE